MSIVSSVKVYYSTVGVIILEVTHGEGLDAERRLYELSLVQTSELIGTAAHTLMFMAQGASDHGQPEPREETDLERRLAALIERLEANLDAPPPSTPLADVIRSLEPVRTPLVDRGTILKPLEWPEMWQAAPPEAPVGVDQSYHTGGRLWNRLCAERGYDAAEMAPGRIDAAIKALPEDEQKAFWLFSNERERTLRKRGWHPYQMEQKPKNYTGPVWVDVDGQPLRNQASEPAPTGRFMSVEEAQQILAGFSAGRKA